MSGHEPRWRDAARWGACFAMALCFHLAGAAALMAHWRENDDLVVNAPAIMVELAPLPVATRTKPTQLPPGPEQAAVKPQPEPRPVKPADRVTLKPEPAKTAELSVTPPLKPAAKPRPKAPPRQRARLASAPSSAEHQSARAAAPAPGAASHNRFALPNWKSALVARLERYKRYPAEAQARGEQGVVQLAFNVDRQGRVHNARILRSSGSHLLDRATLALIDRAQPLPVPPPDIHGAEIAIVVPIRYNIR